MSEGKYRLLRRGGPALVFVALLTAFAAAEVHGARPLAVQRGASATDLNFSGSGGKSLPPIRVRRPSTLLWSASGGIFQLFSSGLSGGDVNSQAASGWTYLTPGSIQYTVNAIGSWRIRVATGVIPPKAIGGGLLSYAGNGGMTLPPLRIAHAGTLHWRATGGLFQLFSSGFSGGDVNSQAGQGTTYLSGGTYQFTVNALGSWKIWWKS